MTLLLACTLQITKGTQEGVKGGERKVEGAGGVSKPRKRRLKSLDAFRG